MYVSYAYRDVAETSARSRAPEACSKSFSTRERYRLAWVWDHRITDASLFASTSIPRPVSSLSAKPVTQESVMFRTACAPATPVTLNQPGNFRLAPLRLTEVVGMACA